MKLQQTHILLALAGLALLFPSFARAQAGEHAEPVWLRVGGDVAHPLEIGPSDMQLLPRRAVQAKDHDGKAVSFEGITLSDILVLAGVPTGEHAKTLDMYLVVEASDGYRVAFSLPELNSTLTDKVVIVADSRDGKPLTATEGPLRLVVPDEKRQARWVRQVITITIKKA
jgi:DMSO/TMAO reductase YedYZ molybdopterin-dependent catalytic subunit